MAKILLLETATEICSVGLWEDGKLLKELTSDSTYQHTSALTVMIKQIMALTEWSMSQLDAVAISAGPGSYTALRVGAAAAKGICFAGDKPLIAVDTLHSLAYGMLELLQVQPEIVLCPMIDARRMEAYVATYNGQLELLSPATAEILDAAKLQEFQGEAQHLYLGGNGAEKCRELLTQEQSILTIQCSAKHLGALAEQQFQEENYADIAYFSPNYLKPPNITTPKPVWR